jgi:hypothetical protein
MLAEGSRFERSREAENVIFQSSVAKKDYIRYVINQALTDRGLDLNLHTATSIPLKAETGVAYQKAPNLSLDRLVMAEVERKEKTGREFRRDRDLEERLLTGNNIYYAMRYAVNVLGHRWFELEDRLAAGWVGRGQGDAFDGPVEHLLRTYTFDIARAPIAAIDNAAAFSRDLIQRTKKELSPIWKADSHFTDRVRFDINFENAWQQNVRINSAIEALLVSNYAMRRSRAFDREAEKWFISRELSGKKLEGEAYEHAWNEAATKYRRHQKDLLENFAKTAVDVTKVVKGGMLWKFVAVAKSAYAMLNIGAKNDFVRKLSDLHEELKDQEDSYARHFDRMAGRFEAAVTNCIDDIYNAHITYHEAPTVVSVHPTPLVEDHTKQAGIIALEKLVELMPASHRPLVEQALTRRCGKPGIASDILKDKAHKMGLSTSLPYDEQRSRDCLRILLSGAPANSDFNRVCSKVVGAIECAAHTLEANTLFARLLYDRAGRDFIGKRNRSVVFSEDKFLENSYALLQEEDQDVQPMTRPVVADTDDVIREVDVISKVLDSHIPRVKTPAFSVKREMLDEIANDLRDLRNGDVMKLDLHITATETGEYLGQLHQSICSIHKQTAEARAKNTRSPAREMSPTNFFANRLRERRALDESQPWKPK